MDGRNPAPLRIHGKPLFIGIYRGFIIPGFLRWCRISSIHSMLGCSDFQKQVASDSEVNHCFFVGVHEFCLFCRRLQKRLGGSTVGVTHTPLGAKCGARYGLPGYCTSRLPGFVRSFRVDCLKSAIITFITQEKRLHGTSSIHRSG